MKKLFLIILLLSFSVSYCQETNQRTSLEPIDNVKTKLPAIEVNKLLIGDWVFEKLTDSTKLNEIREVIHKINDTIIATEIVERPSIRIKADGTYEKYDCPTDSCETGNWNYDSTAKILKFKFKEPQYNVPIDRLAPGLLEKLKETGQLIVSEGFEWEIAEITKNELIIIERLRRSELDYNLRIYTKK